MHTPASGIVQGFVQKHLSSIHAARRQLWCQAVSAVMGGHWLSLSRLARAVMGEGTQKAALKRVDRLIGNKCVAQEARVVGAATASRVVPGRAAPGHRGGLVGGVSRRRVCGVARDAHLAGHGTRVDDLPAGLPRIEAGQWARRACLARYGCTVGCRRVPR